MKVGLVPMGDARGVPLPEAVIAQCGFGDQVYLSVEPGRVILSRVPAPREGWAAAFDAAPDDGPTAAPDRWADYRRDGG